MKHTFLYFQTGLTFAGAGAGAGAGSGATLVVPGAAGTCGPLRRPLNLLNMSRDQKVHLLYSLQVATCMRVTALIPLD